jgi:hypothetical protein
MLGKANAYLKGTGFNSALPPALLGDPSGPPQRSDM